VKIEVKLSKRKLHKVHFAASLNLQEILLKTLRGVVSKETDALLPHNYIIFIIIPLTQKKEKRGIKLKRK